MKQILLITALLAGAAFAKPAAAQTRVSLQLGYTPVYGYNRDNDRHRRIERERYETYRYNKTRHNDYYYRNDGYNNDYNNNPNRRYYDRDSRNGYGRNDGYNSGYNGAYNNGGYGNCSPDRRY